MRPLNTARITSMVGAVALTLGSASLAMADDIKVGVLLGFTGPIESLTPDMAEAAELALEEVTASGALLDGRSIVSVRGDSTCIDAAAATASAERLVTSDSVVAIMGADCSGVTIAVTNNVARAQRNRHRLTIGDFASPDDDRGQWPVLPHGPPPMPARAR